MCNLLSIFIDLILFRQRVNTLNIYSNGNKNNKQQACDDMG